MISSRRSHAKVGLLCRPELGSCEIQKTSQVSTTLLERFPHLQILLEMWVLHLPMLKSHLPPQKNTEKSFTAPPLDSSSARLELNGHQISVEDFGATAFGECLANCGTIWNLLNCTGNVENLEFIESSL